MQSRMLWKLQKIYGLELRTSEPMKLTKAIDYGVAFQYASWLFLGGAVFYLIIKGLGG